MNTSEFTFELLCENREAQNKIEKRLFDMLEARGYEVQSNMAIQMVPGHNEHVRLSEPEQQFIWDLLFIESEKSLAMYAQSDLDIMSGIMDKLQPTELS